MTLMAPTEKASPPPKDTPALAKTVMRTCSFILNGPGFKENYQPIKGTLASLFGRTTAMNLPVGKTRIREKMEDTARGCVL